MSGTFNWSKLGIKTKLINSELHYWDGIRKKYLLCTPEEEVRQFTILLLQDAYQIPFNSIALEKQLKVFNKKKRYDILVFDTYGQPLLLVECKRVSETLKQETMMQACQYNQEVKAPFILITNGIDSIPARIDFANGHAKLLEKLPNYKDMQPLNKRI
jgi:hypothetical protein